MIFQKAFDSYNNGKYEEALSLFVKAKKNNEEPILSNFCIGHCYFFLGEMDLAMQALLTFIDETDLYFGFTRLSSEAYTTLAGCYVSKQKHQLALDAYDDAIKHYPNNAKAWARKGYCIWQQIKSNEQGNFTAEDTCECYEEAGKILEQKFELMKVNVTLDPELYDISPRSAKILDADLYDTDTTKISTTNLSGSYEDIIIATLDDEETKLQEFIEQEIKGMETYLTGQVVEQFNNLSSTMCPTELVDILKKQNSDPLWGIIDKKTFELFLQKNLYTTPKEINSTENQPSEGILPNHGHD